jgi:hypothetical protein
MCSTKVSEKTTINKLFSIVKHLWDNVVDNACCSYINTMVHAFCGHYEHIKEDYNNQQIFINFEFIDYWMDLCNSDGLTIDEVEKYYIKTLEAFLYVDQDAIEQQELYEQSLEKDDMPY